MPFGLSDPVLERILSVFAGSPKVDRVRIFGSRALGSFREGSDIDLAIEGAGLELDDLLQLRLLLDNLMLLYRFDLVDVARIENESLRDHIERFGKVVFERGQ
jgi:predicted nucleotidyltransferase